MRPAWGRLPDSAVTPRFRFPVVDSAEANSDMNIEFVASDRFRYTTPNGFVINASRVR